MRMKKVRRCLALALSVGLIFADVAPAGAAEVRQTEQASEADELSDDETEDMLFTSDYQEEDEQKAAGGSTETDSDVWEESAGSEEAQAAVTTDEADELLGTGGRTVGYYSLPADGGSWTGTRYYKKDGSIARDVFFFDGTYTYYLMSDGSPMHDSLTYHPDGEHIIYFDASGHEVFTSFQYCSSVGYTCYFDSNGYIYKDQITFVGNSAYYLNANGALEQNGWFQFANGRDYGYANGDGTLMTNGFSYDPWGRVVFYHWNGMVARGLITDGAWYYQMDETDGHYVGQFPNTSVTMTSKKGLQGTEGVLSDTGLGVKHSAINVMINQLVSKEPTKWSFNYNGTDYYFTDPGGIDEYVKKANQMGVTVSIILLMPWDETKQNLIYAGGRKSGHKFYAMNPDDPTVAATFCFLAQRYGQADCHIDNWILGNEVNIPNTYNYCGTLDLNTNASIYAATFIQLYNALQNLNPGARAYIPFDHNWTSNEKGTGIAAKNYLTAFWLAVNARQPGVNWNIAYHLYPPVLTSSKMWLPKYTKYTPNNENAQYISAANLNVLTDYVQNHFGAGTRIILSEQGFTSREGEEYQAAALAYTFYAAQFNNMIDAVIFRSYETDPNDEGLDLGLKETGGRERPAYQVFKYMDTANGTSYTDPYLSVIGVSGWSQIVPNYNSLVNWN